MDFDFSSHPGIRLGTATQYQQLQLLNAIIGNSVAVPTSFHMHLSKRPVTDTGSVDEYSFDTYASQTIAGWTTSGGSGVEIASATASITFPTPTTLWWIDNHPIFPYITDQSGTVLWYFQARFNRVDASTPLTMIGGDIRIGWALNGASPPSGFCSAVDSGDLGLALDMLNGGAAYASHTSLEVAFASRQFVGIIEPSAGAWDSPPDSLSDVSYTRRTWGGWTTPAIVGGKAQCANASGVSWVVNPTGTVGNHPTLSDEPWRGGPNSFIALYISGSSSQIPFAWGPCGWGLPARDDVISVPAESLILQVD